MTARSLRIVPGVGGAVSVGGHGDGGLGARGLGVGAHGDGGHGDGGLGAGGHGDGDRPDGAALLASLTRSAADRRWTTRALCAAGDPDRLFVTGAAQREAAKLCRDCPVQVQCLADALDNRVEFGVWGGLTERQRRALLKRRPDVASWRLVLEQAREDARRSVAS